MNVKLIACTKVVSYDFPYQEKNSEQFLPVQTARISYRSESIDQEADRKLNEKLIKAGHHTPLESINYTFLVENVSKILLGQITRHRIGIGFTAQSGRRVDLSDVDYYLPNIDYCEMKDYAEQVMKNFYLYANDVYKELLSVGVRPQEARYILPASRLTSFYMYINARALRHFFELRLDKHAEGEINQLARKLFDVVYEIHPILYEDLIRLRKGGK